MRSARSLTPSGSTKPASASNQNEAAPKTDLARAVAGVGATALASDACRSKPGRRSTSYVDWPTLMARTFAIDVLQCTRCSGRLEPIAVITKAETAQRILSHLRLPIASEPMTDGYSVGYDVTEQPMPSWATGTDPEPDEDARGPPSDYDGVDPPSPED